MIKNLHIFISFLSIIFIFPFHYSRAQDRENTKSIKFSGIIRGIKPSSNGKKYLEITYPSKSNVKDTVIALNNNDAFAVNLKPIEGRYFISYEHRVQFQLYFKPNENYYIEYTDIPQSNNLPQEVTFSGPQISFNNYLIRKYQEKSFFNPLENKSEDEYLNKLNEWKARELRRVETFNLPDSIKIFENKSIEYEYLDVLNIYSYYRPIIDSSYVASEKVTSLLNIDYDNEKDYFLYGHYEKLVKSHYFSKLEDIEKDSLKSNQFFDLTHRSLNLLNQIVPNQAIRNDLISYYASSDINKVKNIEAYYNDFLKYYTGDDIKIREELQDAYLRLTKLKKGTPSPKFYDFKNYHGGTNALDDFKGKYVFIDIWASWCGNCINEFPYIRKLVEKYKDKSIVFISISTDADSNNWKEAIERANLSGIHLLATKKNNTFMDEYNITGIPRYILLDPELNIVDYNTPRPSEVSKLEELFKESGIE